VAVKFIIQDGKGGKDQAHVTPNHELLVTSSGLPPITEIGEGGYGDVKIFRDYMRKSDGAYNMLVAGSLGDPVDFSISAVEDGDRYISMLSFMILDQGATLSDFGAIAALANGCHLFYETETEVVDIHSNLKTNWDFCRLCFGTPPLGNQSDAFRAQNVVGSAEGYIPFLHITMLVPPYGILLAKGTQRKITLRIRDDISAIDAFDCIAYGFDRIG
jgi:hypothetical protein